MAPALFDDDGEATGMKVTIISDPDASVSIENLDDSTLFELIEAFNDRRENPVLHLSLNDGVETYINADRIIRIDVEPSA